jgi:N-acetylglucosamine-6-phosphate deacetylase
VTSNHTQPFDLQVNGSFGVDFNAPTLDARLLQQWMLDHRANGGGQILATIITADLPTMQQRMANLHQILAELPELREIIVGIHLEGPFISPEPGYVGAHPREDVIPANPTAMQHLLDAGRGMVKLVTLAPECDADSKVTSLLAAQGIVVSAGHTAANMDTLKAAIQAGLSMFTHVGNGCPVQLPRHDNIIQRALSLCADLWLCFIPDGAHIPHFALQNYLRAVPLERTIMVTDSISAAGLGPGQFPLGKASVKVGSDLIARAPDGIHLAGSTLTMARLRHTLRETLHWTDSQIDLVTVHNPRLACS